MTERAHPQAFRARGAGHRSHLLTPVGPLGMLDRAIALAREGGMSVAGRAWAGGGLLAAAVVGVYYLERVEGVGSLRVPLAFALVLAWWGRAYLMGRAARHVVLALWPAGAGSAAMRPADVLRTSVVVGLGMWLWGWVLLAGTLAGPVGVVLALPLLSLRGAVAPSWLARSACTSVAGLRGFYAAFRDNAGRRAAGLLTESMLLAGALAIALNLYATAFAALLLARSFVGLEVTAVESFLSPSNTFSQLVIGAVAVVLLEPVRAALSAALFVDARVRADGLDLRVALDDAIAHSARASQRREQRASAVRVVGLLVACAIGAGSARAQPPAALPPPPPEVSGGSDSAQPGPLPLQTRPLGRRVGGLGAEASSSPDASGPTRMAARRHDVASLDRKVQAQVEGILGRREFREFEDLRGRGFRQLIERLLASILKPPDDLPQFERPSLGNFSLPGAWFFVAVGVALLLAVAAYLWATRRREAQASERAEREPAGKEDPRERSPSSFLDESARLAEEGDLRAALRALYLATLVALDRRRLIAFEPFRTNWQYLRQMPNGPSRDAFRHFTREFDYKWYGHEVTTRPDYERCRALATEIVGEESEVA